VRTVQSGVQVRKLHSGKSPSRPLKFSVRLSAEIEIGYQKLIDGCRQVIDAWKPDIEGYLDEELKLYLEQHPEKKEELKDGWQMVRLGEVCEIKAGGTPSTSEKSYYDNGTIPWLKSEVCKDAIIDKPLTFITEEGLKKSAAKMLKANSTLIALVGATIGKTGFITYEASTNQNVAGLYPLEIPLPPLEVQEVIVAKIEAERKVIDGCRELIKTYEDKIKRVIDKVWEG
jgi:type I restriction enzyme M protein